MNVLVKRSGLRRATSVLAVATLTAGVGILGIAQPASAAAATIDRAAFGVSANGLVDIAKTPNCPERTTTGTCDKSVAAINRTGVLTTGVLNAETRGRTNPLRAISRASVADVNALDGLITATLIESSCRADANGVNGTTTLTNLDVAGIRQNLTVPPNTKIGPIDVVGLGTVTVILNEQKVTNGGNQIVVNAVRITVRDLLGVSQRITIASSQCSFHPADAPPAAGTGILEICKKADNGNGAVTGRFTFRFNGRSVTVPVGSCSGPLKVPAGNLTVREVAKDGTRISNCSTRPLPRLVRCDPANRLAVVRIVEGGVANETVLTITNKRTVIGSNMGAIKVCKIAGNGVQVGRNFNFTVGGRNITVAAGRASQGGTCKVVSGFLRGKQVKVTEAFSRGTHVSRIAVRPVARKVSANKATRTATVQVGKGFTVVSFTNTAN